MARTGQISTLPGPCRMGGTAMRWARLFRTVTPLVGIAVAVSACGSASTSPRDTVTASSAQASAQKGITPTVSTSSEPLGGSDFPTSVEPGKVTITLSASKYRSGSVVSAVVANGLGAPLYTEDAKSDCSI